MIGTMTGTQAWSNPRVLLAMLMALGLLAMQSGRGTLAYFTSTASSTGNQFIAGQLKLLFNGGNPTGAITFDTTLTTLTPGIARYGYFTVENDNTDSDAVNALFNGTSNGTITVTRTQSLLAPSDATKAADLDGRLNLTVKEVSGTAAITDSTSCAVPANWSAVTNTAVGTSASVTGAGATVNRAALTSGTATAFITDAITIAPAAVKKYCVEFQWPDGTAGAGVALDNAAKQGSNTYTITFNGASS